MDELARRVTALEADMKDVKATLGRMEPMLARMDERLRFTATKEDLTKLATKDELIKLSDRVARVEGAIRRMPTTLQLLGFIIGMFVLSGLMTYLRP